MRYFFALPLVLLGLFCACQSPGFPSLTIPLSPSKDSLAWLYLSGDSLSRRDSLIFLGEPLSLNPDTNLYQSALVAYGSGNYLRYFALSRGQWQEAEPPRPLDSLPSDFPETYFPNIHREYQSIWAGRSPSRAVVMFGDLEHRMPSRDSIAALKAKYPKDSLRLVYMYLAVSDSMVRRLMKRDTLRGLAFSDTLGEVSRLRERLGIARSPRVHTFVVDSTMRILER